ncbi:MAG: alpha/beta hydrolase [Myxococcota bacterium]|nr:alpha/beta hydrolase [Myxococcota bacterium]
MDSRFVRFSSKSRPGLFLHALTWGDPEAPPLVLLHGGGANAHWWDHMAEPLARRRRVIALDFRGHGDSDYPDALEVGAFNFDLEALCEFLGTARFDLVGHSMGAQVALDHASRHPETGRVVLLDLARGASRRSRRIARLALALRRTYENRGEAIDRYRVIPPSEGMEPALLRAIANHSVREDDDGRWGFKFDPRWFTIASRPAPDLSQVRSRVLLMRGGESKLLSPEGAEEFSGQVSGARVLTIPGAGHHVHLDQPEHVLTGLIEFLES